MALNVIIEILMIGFRKSPQPAGIILFKEVTFNLILIFYNLIFISIIFVDNNNVWTTRKFYSPY